MSNEKKGQQIEIPKDKHSIVAFYCKWKGISMKKYICQRLESDHELKNFESKIKEMKFR